MLLMTNYVNETPTKAKSSVAKEESHKACKLGKELGLRTEEELGLRTEEELGLRTEEELGLQISAMLCSSLI
jgi:hypothetical protein